MVTTRQPTLLAQIEAEEEVLLDFWTRFVALQAFEAELVARTGTSPFIIANTVVWDAMIGKRDLLVIHFASWIRGMCEPGGFFGQLRAHHVPELRKAFIASRNEVPKLHGRERRRSRIDPRFPDAVERGKLDPDDVDALKNAVWSELEPIIKDRDSFRAHPFERGQKADARLLRLDEVEGMLEGAQRLFNDLRLLADNSTFGYSYQSLTGAEEAAADLVDLLLFGSTLRFATVIGANDLKRRGAYWWQCRAAFLQALRVEHEARPDLPVNHDALIELAEKKAADFLREEYSRQNTCRLRARRLWYSLRRRVRVRFG